MSAARAWDRFVAGLLYALAAEQCSLVARCHWGPRANRNANDDRNTRGCPVCHERFDLAHALWFIAEDLES
jgi:hypothetical protein